MKGKDISGIYDKYGKSLNNQDRKVTLRILNEGLCEEFFSLEKN